MAVRFLLLLVCLASVSAFSSVGCVDNEGNPVDWWFIYKLPTLSGSNQTDSGYAYSYFDARSSGKLSVEGSLRQNNHALSKTLTTISGPNSAFVIYNDQPADGSTHSSHGHLKGVVGASAESGFWLVHSTPKYPRNAKDPSFPDEQTMFGQTFLCLSLDLDGINAAAAQLLYSKPYVVEKNLPSTLSSKIPNLEKVISGEWITEAGSSVEKLKVGSKTFVSFAKNANWAKHLYVDLVAPFYKADMLVQTWRRSPYLPSFCKPTYEHDVLNVESIILDEIEWSYTNDHAKWGAIINGEKAVCVGDINRMDSQTKRGGGTVCFEHSSLWNALKNTILTSSECK